jgi:riboflavin synthase
MFTGIIEELGTVRRITPNATGAQLEIQCTTVLEDARVGDSIAVNGCCLTLVSVGNDGYSVDAVEETLKLTSLGGLNPDDRVNLERSVRLSDRLGGHLVQGHVDGVGSLIAREPAPDGSVLMRFSAPDNVLRYVAYKGSIAVDGISLTVARLDDDGFGIAVIPHTLAVTTLGALRVGGAVNLEADVVAKYVERLLRPTPEGAVYSVAP